MATLGVVGNVGGIVNTYAFTAITDTNTWTGPASGVYWFVQTNNPSTQASAGVSIARSGTTYTFYPGESAATGILFIEKREG
jgi:hypothetical protein